ncbi:MAG: GNAT family N-acetyltransferase [Verrucomicrobia bacterium]|nr:GNAT family N-acetyltransferase [Verrucomicrobiota bacterium]
METIEVDYLCEPDLDVVDRLGSRYKKTIGFFTKETFRDYLNRNRVLGARTAEGDLVGYLLFADYPDRIRIGQLCVAEEFRGKGIARKLFDRLKDSATGQTVIRLWCRRDFEAANKTWAIRKFL